MTPAMTVAGPAHLALRAATAGEHERVDAAYGAFDLADRASYGAFLTAHARALPAVEDALGVGVAGGMGEGGIAGLPPLRSRADLLAADLAALGLPWPAPLAVDPPAGAAEAFGMAYVIEGSRLGGGMLARRIGAGLPGAYLAAVHLPGEWRAFHAALDAAAAGAADPADWRARAEAAARRTFALYRAAAAG